MEITVRVKNINYGELIEKFLPMVREKLKEADGVMAKTLYGITCLPAGMMRAAIDALPQNTKDEFVVYMLNKNRNVILEKAPEFMASQGISMTVEDIKVSSESQP